MHSKRTGRHAREREKERMRTYKDGLCILTETSRQQDSQVIQDHIRQCPRLFRLISFFGYLFGVAGGRKRIGEILYIYIYREEEERRKINCHPYKRFNYRRGRLLHRGAAGATNAAGRRYLRWRRDLGHRLLQHEKHFRHVCLADLVKHTRVLDHPGGFFCIRTTPLCYKVNC